jgi:AcrR family transcriptional regulator
MLDNKKQPRVRIPNAERTETTRAVLLDATIKAIVMYGYQGATSQRIAELSGFTRGAQKHHFNSKAELVAAALVDLHARYLVELSSRLAKGNPADLDHVVKTLWESLQSDLWTASLDLRITSRIDADLCELLFPAEQQIGRRALDFVVNVLDDGRYSRQRLREAANLAFNTLRGMALQRVLYADTQRESRQLRVLTQSLRALLDAHVADVATTA